MGELAQKSPGPRVRAAMSGISAQAEQLYRQAIVWDNVWPLEPWCGNDFDSLQKFIAAGVTAVSITVAGDNHNAGETIQRIAAVRRQILHDPRRYVLVERLSDITEAKRSGQLALTLHFEGTRCFERNLDLVEAYFRLGVRHALLAFNLANSVGGGCAEAHDGGLTSFGRRLVTEMERVGMLVDLSHTGYRTGMDVMEMANRPVIFSHSNSAALHAHFRNLTDEQARACAATGGVIGISASTQYLGGTEASAEAIVRHLDYYAQLIGPQHVALGLDLVFNAAAVDAYMRARPDEWPMTKDPAWPGCRYARPEQILELTEILLARGYDAEDVLDILGRNYLRIYASIGQ